MVAVGASLLFPLAPTRNHGEGQEGERVRNPRLHHPPQQAVVWRDLQETRAAGCEGGEEVCPADDENEVCGFLWTSNGQRSERGVDGLQPHDRVYSICVVLCVVLRCKRCAVSVEIAMYGRWKAFVFSSLAVSLCGQIKRKDRGILSSRARASIYARISISDHPSRRYSPIPYIRTLHLRCTKCPQDEAFPAVIMSPCSDVIVYIGASPFRSLVTYLCSINMYQGISYRTFLVSQQASRHQY